MADGEERVVETRHVLVVSAHLFHRPGEIEGEAPLGWDRPGQRIDERVVAGAEAGHESGCNGQQRRQDSRPVEAHVHHERAVPGHSGEERDEAGWEVQ